VEKENLKTGEIMSKKLKPKRVLVGAAHPPDSFTRAELLKAIKKVAAARRQRQKTPESNGSK
jgi:hypothetical protein